MRWSIFPRWLSGWACKRYLPVLGLVIVVSVLTGCGEPSGPSSATAQSLGFGASAGLQAANATPTKAAIPKATATAGGAGKTENGCALTMEQAQAEQHLLNRLNQHRADAGVAPLTLNHRLATVAREHACDMALHHKLSHTWSDGRSPFAHIKDAGISYAVAGENIGTAYSYGIIGGIDRNDADMMAEPLECCNHHWNIVNPKHTQVGIGVIYIAGQEWLAEDFIG